MKGLLGLLFVVVFYFSSDGVEISKELKEKIIENTKYRRDFHTWVPQSKNFKNRIKRSFTNDQFNDEFETKNIEKRFSESFQVGKNMTFYSTRFDGSFQDFSWDLKHNENITVLVGNTPYISNNKGKNYFDISSRLREFNTVHSKLYGPKSGGFGVRSIEESVWNPSLMVFTGRGTTIWITRDSGETFTKVDTKQFFLEIHLHPRMADTMIGTSASENCFDSVSTNDSDCNIQLFVSKNYGNKWELLADYIYSFSWGKYGDDVRYDEVLYYTQSIKKVQQFSYNTTSETIKMIKTDTSVYAYVFRTKSIIKIFDRATQIAVNNLLIYVQANDGQVLVSNGGMKFKGTNFNGYELRGYTFIEFAYGTVGVIDSPNIQESTNTGYSNYQGDLWFSELTGVYFVRSLQKVPLITNGNGMFSFDFHKIHSMDGTYIANSVGVHGKLRSRISWNRGASWVPVKTREAAEGLIDEEVNPFVLYGTVYSEISGGNEAIYSHDTAPGLIIALGKHNVNIVQFVSGKIEDGDVYYSRNGGKIFDKILSGNHYCKIINQGSIIVCVPAGLTNVFKYSLDGGMSWRSEEFIGNAVDVNRIYNDPDSSKITIIIESLDENQIIYTYVDLKELSLPTCSESQYEKWIPTDSELSKLCVLGQKKEYIRASKDSECFSNLNNFITHIENCPCGPSDFGCNFNYFYNYSSKICVPEEGSPVEEIHCINGYYFRDQHMRKVPNNMCDENAKGSIDYGSKIKTKCPDIITDYFKRTQALAIGLGIGLTCAFLIIAAAIVFVIWSRRKGYLHYKPVRTQDMAIGPDDPTPFDYIQDPDHQNQNQNQ